MARENDHTPYGVLAGMRRDIDLQGRRLAPKAIEMTPTSSTDPRGLPGQVAYDANYLYVLTDTGWRRAALASW